MRKLALVLPVAVMAAGCARSTFEGARLDAGPAAYSVIPATRVDRGEADYHIGALDRIDVVIFQEPDLSGKAIEVNAAGRIALPLIGDVTAAGKTGSELAAEIARLYGARVLVNPRVSVTVAQSVSQKIVVQGEVTEPGVYEIKGHATLLEAISMAKGESRVASTRQVAVFRTIDGKRSGALFDVSSIRRGEADDPELQGNDVVVVGLSRIKNTWRDVLASAPFLNLFRPLGY